MYRVTPVFEGDNLVAKGVQMEALSVEDDGSGISFNVFVFNAQPGIEINYADGTSKLINDNSKRNEDTTSSVESENKDNSYEQAERAANGETTYILNTNTKKIHYPDCPSLDDTKEKNKEIFNGSREYLIENGYTPCSRCNP